MTTNELPAMYANGMLANLTFTPRPFKDNRRRFEAKDQWTGSGMWPEAHLVVKTSNSVYVVHIQGGSSQTLFTLDYTSNETAAQFEGDQVTLGVSGNANTLLTDVLYGRREVADLKKLNTLVGRSGWLLTFEDGKGMYGCESEVTGRWQITTIQSIELRAGRAR